MKKLSVVFILAVICTMFVFSCGKVPQGTPIKSASGVKKTSVVVKTDIEGLTSEQHNVRDRILEDNIPGAIKHLYVISAYSGQVLIYSTVRGKVTSGGKRLTPTTVSAIAGQYNEQGSFVPINVAGENYRTSELLEDDGTYGHSMDYLYWWDTKGIYHQHYVSGGQIVHISNQPLAVKEIVINMELSK